jgi:hypothetical protein
MNAGQVRKQIDAIDQRLKELCTWEKRLGKTRRQWLIDDSDGARWALDVIDHGISRGQGRPAALDLPQLDSGWPGLITTRETIAQLTERRATLIGALPPKSETSRKTKEAEASAVAIRARAKKLAKQTAAAEVAIREAAALALTVAEDTRRLWENNLELDSLTADAGLTRSETPRPDAAHFTLAAPLAALLNGYFCGGQPNAVQSDLARDIRKGAK